MEAEVVVYHKGWGFSKKHRYPCEIVKTGKKKSRVRFKSWATLPPFHVYRPGWEEDIPNENIDFAQTKRASE